MSLTVIFQDAVPSFAGVTVYDRGHDDSTGRYSIRKTMKLPNGKIRLTHSYRHQRPAALAFARRFLAERAAKAGVTYESGDGRDTVAGTIFNGVRISPTTERRAA